MLLYILLILVIFIIYLEYRDNINSKKKIILEKYEIQQIIKNCNPNIIQFYKQLNGYDKRLIQVYLSEILNSNYQKVQNISKKEIYNKVKSTSYVLCSKYLLEYVNQNSIINTPLASALGYICQTYI
jgi:hypothetical protein